MAMRTDDMRREQNSFVESMLRKAEERNTTKPRSLFDSVDIEEVQRLTAEIKAGSKSHGTRKNEF